MPLSALPAVVGIILLSMVAALALLAEWRAAAARWFALFNVLLATTAGLGQAGASTAYGAAGAALWLGKLANFSAALAFAAFFLQLAALGRTTDAPSIVRLRRWAWPLALFALATGALYLLTPWLVRGAVWVPGHGYGPLFGPAVPFVLVSTVVSFGWAATLLASLYRHGTARLRREVSWIAVGVLVFDAGGLILLGVVLPRLGLPTLRWASTALAAGSAVMLGAMVLTRQREIEQRESGRSWAGRRLAAAGSVHAEPSARACITCGGMLTPRSDMIHCPLDGGAIVEGLDPWPGRTLDERYVVGELLGAGAMGRVYRARDSRRNSDVALKVLDVNLAADARTTERFAREARSAMRVRSPHVVIVHELGSEPPGIPYLTMELIDGPSLRKLLRGAGRLSARSVAQLGAQLATGLQAAHAQGVVHRDLKPDNVLVAVGSEADVVKIVDFGLAKISDELSEGSALTTTGRVMGTPAYLSPEQASGQPAGPKSDVYALGVVLYRARSGQRLFDGPALTMLARHIGAAPPPLGDSALDRLIMSLLAKAPDDRPEAAALVTRFTALAEGGERRLTLESGGAVARTALEPTPPLDSDSDD